MTANGAQPRRFHQSMVSHVSIAPAKEGNMTKRALWMLIGVFVVVLAGWKPMVAHSDDAPEHAFVGADKCKMCHNSAKKGAQYTKWKEAKHSKAYETLATDKAKEAASAKGIDDPQNAPECLRCHVTGYGAPEEMLTDKYKIEDGVGCESCHGPGADYYKMATMKDREKSIEAGLVIPDAETCTRCHNEDSPFFQGFDFETFYAKIAHEMPPE